MTEIEDFDLPFTTRNSRQALNERQIQEYEQTRKRFATWLLTRGKDPKKGRSFSESTVKDTLYRMDKLHRWVWENFEGYNLHISEEKVDAFFEARVNTLDDNHSETDNAGYLKSVKRYFKWRKYELGGSEWDPDWSFRSDLGPHHDQPKYSLDECQELEEAVLEYGSIPNRKTTPVDEREKWRIHLSQRFGKTKDEISPDDWERAESWKFPSMLSVSIDTGLRPVEVGNARVGWLNLEDGVIRIPVAEGSKSRDNWEMPIRIKTVNRLKAWKAERDNYPKYDGTDELWLTREGNPYGSASLKYFLKNLSEIAGIDREKHHWYMLRRSLATSLADAKTTEHARDQLRHQSTDTTERYVQTSNDQRKEGIESMFSN